MAVVVSVCCRRRCVLLFMLLFFDNDEDVDDNDTITLNCCFIALLCGQIIVDIVKLLLSSAMAVDVSVFCRLRCFFVVTDVF